jgi:hypothetical protein
MTAIGSEALLAASYSVFLLLCAGGLDVLARHSHRRSEAYRTAGFVFHGHLDAWECPEGERLLRVDTDHHQRLARYRARAPVCNECPAKGECTDSDAGREITRALDPWPHSEAGRFHRGIGVVMIALATLIAAVALVRNTEPAELLMLGSVLAIAMIVLVRTAESFRATPTGFPGTPVGPSA